MPPSKPSSSEPAIIGWGSIDEAAAYLGVSTKSVRRYIADGLLPARRMGPRLIRVRLADLDTLGQPLTVAR